DGPGDGAGVGDAGRGGLHAGPEHPRGERRVQGEADAAVRVRPRPVRAAIIAPRLLIGPPLTEPARRSVASFATTIEHMCQSLRRSFPDVAPVRAFLDASHLELAGRLAEVCARELAPLEPPADDDSARRRARELLAAMGAAGLYAPIEA